MPIKPSFPDSVWDGGSKTRMANPTDPLNEILAVPDGHDWLRASAEIVAVQNYLSGIQTAAKNGFEADYTIPKLVDYTWVNRGAATAFDDGKGIFLTTPAAAQNDMKLLVIPTGATPWSYVAKIIPSNLSVSTPECGIVYCQGISSGHMHTIRFTPTGPIDSVEFFSPTSFNNVDWSYTTDLHTNFTWVRLVNDGAFISISVSIDGTHWIVLKSDHAIAYLGDPFDHVGFFVEGAAATWPSSAKLVSAKLN